MDILGLPVDIVSEIFFHYLPEYPLCPPTSGFGSPTLLSHVCRRWRDITLDTPTLWRAILVRPNVAEPAAVPGFLDRLETWFRRSSSCLLSIHLRYWNSMDSGPFAVIFETLVAQRHRWEHLDLWLYTQDFGLIHAVGSDTEMPALRRVRYASPLRDPFHTSWHRPPCLVFSKAPQLRQLELTERWPQCKLAFPWAQLTRFIWLANVSSPAVCDMLRKMRNLVHCQVRLASREEDTLQPLHLAYLETLVVGDGGTNGRVFLDALTLPALRKLDIHGCAPPADPDWHHFKAVEALVGRSKCRLEELSVVDYKGAEVNGVPQSKEGISTSSHLAVNVNDLAQASQTLSEAVGLTEKEATTVWRRAKGKAKPRLHAQSRQQLLTPIQEGVHSEWIKFYRNTGIPLSQQMIRAKVHALCGKTPGSHWVVKFLRWHPDVTLGRPTGLDPQRAYDVPPLKEEILQSDCGRLQRARAFNPANVKVHFELLSKELIHEGRPVPLRNIYNMDEIGIQRGGGRKNSNELFFYSSSDNTRYKIKSDNLELITILECVCADGTAPVAGAGTLFCEAWFDVEWEGDGEIVIANTPNGWTNADLYHSWLTKGFIPAAQAHGNSNFPIFLMQGGHTSHTGVNSVDAAIENNIKIDQMGSHQTHQLQPCDVGGFGPAKILYRKRCDDIVILTGGPMDIGDVVKEWVAIRTQAFTPATIKRAGHQPDYAPSISTSTTLHLPVSYPAVPSPAPDEETPSSSSESPSSPSTSTPPAFTTPSLSYDYPDSDNDEPPSGRQPHQV
ncbi:hypothetical protein FB45DRAFT_1006077 [Roridomyces roridus]|uniref:HTH CENPB-type domain-containing protein n=1 Tax=Roridomyces roridus TaxID=1738132 RepID=A0AAD7FKA6_9AGAR|nr:hypothetical protein FB45DRAFT_1006077 [Roridomyces roridus]